MPSRLRLHSSLEEPIAADIVQKQTSPSLPPAKKQKMAMSAVYCMASEARSKLGREASRADHHLRRLVGHANLLDNLMLELADAEREQEAWFDQSVRNSAKSVEPRTAQGSDNFSPQDEDDSDDDAAIESDEDWEDDEEFYQISLRPTVSAELNTTPDEFEGGYEEGEMDEVYDEDEEEEYALRRVPSIRHSPPELTHDADSESEDDDSMLSSPDSWTIQLNENDKHPLKKATSIYPSNSQQKGDHYLLQETQQPMIATC